jgi:hypothetical protein
MKMKISPESMIHAVSGVDRLINGIPKRNQQTIKSLFFMIIFGGAVAGVVYGSMMGKENARIKSAPIISSTNEAFDLDIKRERGDGNFNMALDSEVISEMKRIDLNKFKAPTRTLLEPESDSGIVEPEMRRITKDAPGAREQDPIFEGQYTKKPSIDSEVRSIEKKNSPAEERESVLDGEQRESPRIEEGEVPRPGRAIERGRDVKRLEKKRPGRGSDVRTPAPLDSNEGIIRD